jgi:hypothetical protein
MRKAFKCGHVGYGVECHRCAEAKRFEDIAEGKAEPASKDKRKKGKPPAFWGWDKAKFKEEAARLRSNNPQDKSQEGGA